MGLIISVIAGVVAIGSGTIAAMGFGPTGIVAGSIAAGIQSGIGPVAAGSVFAALQSAGQSGLVAVIVVVAGCISSAAYALCSR